MNDLKKINIFEKFKKDISFINYANVSNLKTSINIEYTPFYYIREIYLNSIDATLEYINKYFYVFNDKEQDFNLSQWVLKLQEQRKLIEDYQIEDLRI